MRRSVYLIIGLLLVSLFAAYALSGQRADGPADKVVQLLLLFPAVILLSWYTSARIKRDLSQKTLRIVDRIGTRTFLTLASVLLLVFSIWMAFGPLEGIPKGGDEAACFFQSKIFAAGKLSAPIPPVIDPERFFPSRHLIMDRGMWFGQYTPTHSIVMAPFTRLGISTLLGPLEGVISLIGIFLLIRMWAGERMARIASILLLLSPFFLFMTATHMAHTSNLMFVTWSLYFLSLFWKKDKNVFSFVSGFLLALALTTKPYPIVVWGIFLLILLASRGRKGFRALLGMVLGSLLPVAAFAALNWYYTGSPLKTTYQMARAGRLIGFGPDTAWFPVYGDYDHTVWRGIKNGIRQIGAGTTSLFGWPLLSLVPLVVSLREISKDRRILWLFIPLPAMFILLLPHAWPAVMYGPRHYFTFLPIIMFLSVLGLRFILRSARAKWAERGGSFVFLVLVGLFGISLLLYLPGKIIWKSGPWQTIDSEPWTLARETVESPAVVFMEASEHGYPNILSGINYTSPFLDGDIIYCAHQTPDEDREFMAILPGREPYLFWADQTGSHIEPWNRELAERLLPARSVHPNPTAERDSDQSE